jgi:tetratricopeptide (TPR) repeat protein
MVATRGFRGASDGANAPFVGREDELELLRMLLARAVRERSPQLVTVTGEPGIGKSRLVAEFEADPALAAIGGGALRWARGRATPEEEGAPVAPLSSVIRELSGRGDGPAQDGDAGARLAHRIGELIADTAEREWFLSRIRPLIGASAVDLPDPGSQSESFAAWRRYLEAEAARGTLGLVFEDLQWAGTSLLAFLEHVLDWSADAPMLLLCTARPELYDRTPGWGGGKRSSTTIALATLPPDSTEQLVRGLLRASTGDGGPSSPTQVDAMVERSGGNPLYAEQFVQLLADRLEAGQEASVGGAALPVPETVRDIIAERLAGLPADQRSVLVDAAVMGRVFWPDALGEMDGRGQDEVRTVLVQLSRKELVRASRAVEVGRLPQYSFVHGLVRDVAYDGLPAGERWSKHVAAAAWLERLGDVQTPEISQALAHHYAHALAAGRQTGLDEATLHDLEDRAARSLTVMGDRSAQIDVGQAEQLYREALDLRGPDHPERAELLARVGDMAALAGDPWQAMDLLEEAIDAFLAQDRPLDAARTALDLAYVRWNHGGTVRGREALDRAFELLQGLPPGRELARATADRSADLFFSGDSAGAVTVAEHGFQVANDVGAPELAARLLEVRGMARCDMGDWGGVDDLHAALHACRDLGMGQETARAYLNLGTFVTPIDGPAQALQYFTAGAELAERRGIAEIGMWTKAWQLGVLFELGEWDRILRDAAEVLDWDRARGGSQLRVAAANCMAEVLAYRGEATRAAGMAREFAAEAREIGDPQILLPALAVAAAALTEDGDHAGAAEAVEDFAEVYPARARWVGSLFLQVCVRSAVAADRVDLAEHLLTHADLTTPRGRHVAVAARGILAEARGELANAAGLHTAAASGWAGYGFPFEEAQSRMALARCLFELGRSAEANEAAAAAAATFDRLGALRLGGRARALAARA